MKKYKSLLAILVCICICIGFLGAMPVLAAQYDNSPLQNVYHKLNVDKKLTIGYIGGSVTNGSGADNSETDSWRALTTKWFKSAYPDATVTEKDMSIGGTGTVFALYRMERALLNLQGDAPDLVFIETAINDNYDGVSGNTLKVYMESIIKKIYAKNPKCNIIMVITGDITTMKNSHESGVPFRQEHRDIAAHYNIPVIDVGSYLYDKIYAENGNAEVDGSNNTVWKKYFKDTVHPKNAGYSVYAEKICTYLTDELKNKTLDSSVYANIVLPSADCMSGLITSAYDVDFTNFDFTKNNNFRTDNKTFDAITYKRLISSRLGDTFTVKFKGTHFGIWTMANSVPTKIAYSIDGGAEQSLQIYRASANLKVYMLAENLNSGDHTIKITHSDANSKLEIYSMLIAGDAAMSGEITFIDSKPDDKDEDDNICETKGHKLGEWEITKEVTCQVNGEKTRKCVNSGCSYSENVEIKAEGHKFSKSAITKEPTCTELGTETGTCTVCGQSTTKPIEVLGHNWGKWTIFAKGNCIDKGIQNRTCKSCQEVESRYTALGKHVFADPEISVESTLYSKGIESGKCIYCDAATTQETECGATDKDTGISISNDLGVFDEGTALRVKVLSSQDQLYQSLKSVLPGEFRAYYIAAVLDKKQQQPKENIELTLPIPAGHSVDSDVYFIDEKGKITKLDAVVNPDKSAFIVETNVIGSFAITKPTTDTSIDNNVENHSIIPWIVIASVCLLVCASVVTIIIIVRKRNKSK